MRGKVEDGERTIKDLEDKLNEISRNSASLELKDKELKDLTTKV